MLRKIPTICWTMIIAIICVAAMASTSGAAKTVHTYLQCCPSTYSTIRCCGHDVGDACKMLGGGTGSIAELDDYPGKFFCHSVRIYSTHRFFLPDINQQQQVEDTLKDIFPYLADKTVLYATADIPLALSTGMAGSDTIDLHSHATEDTDVLFLGIEFLPAPNVLSGYFIVRLPNPGEGDTVLVTGPVEVLSTAIPTLNEWGIILFCAILLGWMAWMIVRRNRVNRLSAF